METSVTKRLHQISNIRHLNLTKVWRSKRPKENSAFPKFMSNFREDEIFSQVPPQFRHNESR